MAALLVTYDLIKPGQDYPDLLKTIKSYPWQFLSESSYAIITNKTPQAVYDELAVYLDKNDHLLVITLKKPYWGFHLQAAIDWLTANLPY
jgi:hypothetical protein